MGNKYFCKYENTWTVEVVFVTTPVILFNSIEIAWNGRITSFLVLLLP